jgi:hypothetical protein
MKKMTFAASHPLARMGVRLQADRAPGGGDCLPESRRQFLGRGQKAGCGFRSALQSGHDDGMESRWTRLLQTIFILDGPFLF